ncbi:hypothetical protein BDV33DRAFT_203695 [Aspergillus novoparasiticus]|uniref:Uncharacterized protein n=1 Tax=Aspergillus novoparasiticus TaxID=986946 RepID=A0A5N6ERM5_9EURO|nr:hypothetical protein BDV33DRAFT_203695 [Aspergillus novoparasiticus]
MKIPTCSILIFTILSVCHAGVPPTNGGAQPALPPLADAVKEELEVYNGVGQSNLTADRRRVTDFMKECSVPDQKTSTYGICVAQDKTQLASLGKSKQITLIFNGDVTLHGPAEETRMSARFANI